MKKKLFALLIVFIFFSAGKAQDSLSASIMPHWEQGDAFSFNIKKIKEKEDNGFKQSDSAVFVGTVTVLEVLDDKIRNSYRTNHSIISHFGLGNDYFKNVDLTREIEVIYTTDGEGQFQQIENWVAVQNELTLSFNVLLQNFKKSGTSSAENLVSFEKILTFMKSRNFVEQTIFSELQLLHYLMGIELKNQQEIIFEEETANPLGGDPLRSEAKIKVHSIKPESSEIIISQQKTLNRDDVSKFIATFSKKMDLNSQDFAELLKKSTYEISDHTDFTVNYKIGIPNRIIYRRKSSMVLDGKNTLRNDEILIDRIR
jgi:hypothetical protein